MIPTFKFHGSKCRIAKWILNNINFPINNYYEPFAGRGNTFFYLASKFKYNSAHLNDLYTSDFLIALRDYNGNYEFVPEFIDRNTFDKFNKMSNCQEKSLAESFCTYNGTFWRYGANITNSPTAPSKNKHSKINTIKRFIEAKKLLQSVQISKLDYKNFLNNHNFNQNDLIYCDPPYLQSSKCKLKDITINHEELANILVKLPCKIIVSDYNNQIYDKILIKYNKLQLIRSSCAGNSSGNSLKSIETKWQNF